MKNPAKKIFFLRDFFCVFLKRFWLRNRSLENAHNSSVYERFDDFEGSTVSAKDRGEFGERAAEDFLVKKSFDILARNYRIPAGELDLIARHKETVVFVEVKLLKSKSYMNPEDQVTRAKRRRCEKAAHSWLQKQRRGDLACRFDVVAMVASPQGRVDEILHIEDAWEEGA
jgi:putative endonuclease